MVFSGLGFSAVGHKFERKSQQKTYDTVQLETESQHLIHGSFL